MERSRTWNVHVASRDKDTKVTEEFPGLKTNIKLNEDTWQTRIDEKGSSSNVLKGLTPEYEPIPNKGFCSGLSMSRKRKLPNDLESSGSSGKTRKKNPPHDPESDGPPRKARKGKPTAKVDCCFSDCGSKFSDFKGMTDHLLGVHLRPLQCNTCTSRFGRTSTVKSHEQLRCKGRNRVSNTVPRYVVDLSRRVQECNDSAHLDEILFCDGKKIYDILDGTDELAPCSPSPTRLEPVEQKLEDVTSHLTGDQWELNPCMDEDIPEPMTPPQSCPRPEYVFPSDDFGCGDIPNDTLQQKDPENQQGDLENQQGDLESQQGGLESQQSDLESCAEYTSLSDILQPSEPQNTYNFQEQVPELPLSQLGDSIPIQGQTAGQKEISTNTSQRSDLRDNTEYVSIDDTLQKSSPDFIDIDDENINPSTSQAQGLQTGLSTRLSWFPVLSTWLQKYNEHFIPLAEYLLIWQHGKKERIQDTILKADFPIPESSMGVSYTRFNTQSPYYHTSVPVDVHGNEKQCAGFQGTSTDQSGSYQVHCGPSGTSQFGNHNNQGHQQKRRQEGRGSEDGDRNNCAEISKLNSNPDKQIPCRYWYYNQSHRCRHKRFKSIADMRGHILRQHIKALQCICDKRFGTRSQLIRHQNTGGGCTGESPDINPVPPEVIEFSERIVRSSDADLDQVLFLNNEKLYDFFDNTNRLTINATALQNPTLPDGFLSPQATPFQTLEFGVDISGNLGLLSGTTALDDTELSFCPRDEPKNDPEPQHLYSCTQNSGVVTAQDNTDESTIQSLKTIQKMLNSIERAAQQLRLVEQNAPLMLENTASLFVKNLSPVVAEMLRRLIVDQQNKKQCSDGLAEPHSEVSPMGPPRQKIARPGVRVDPDECETDGISISGTSVAFQASEMGDQNSNLSGSDDVSHANEGTQGGGDFFAEICNGGDYTPAVNNS